MNPITPHTLMRIARNRCAPSVSERNCSMVITLASGCFGSTSQMARRIAASIPRGSPLVRTTRPTGDAPGRIAGRAHQGPDGGRDGAALVVGCVEGVGRGFIESYIAHVVDDADD